jgi:trigger factor
MADKTYSDLKVKELGNSEVEITAAIAEDKLEPFKKETLKSLAKEANVPGFRPGKVPESMIVEKIGEQGLLSEAAEKALQVVYPQIVADENLMVIGRPEVSITKLASGNPFEFKIKTAVAPEVTLPDYKKIAKEEMAVKEKVEVTKEEKDTVINDIRKTRTQVEQAKTAEDEGGKPPKIDPSEKIDEKDLLPLTDEFVKTLGDFKGVEDFEKRIEENLLKEKEMRAKEKKRVAIGEEIIKKSKMTLPEILIESELDKMKAQFEEDVRRMGLEFDDYLKKINKTEEDLRKEWRETAEKRAKLQLILNKIASEEKLFPNEEEIKEQVNHLKEHYKEADESRIRIYVETLLTNEKTFEFLESQ